uniref:Uncharacterized protein n=1 Tax=Brassica oleracea var. oleracea TaxID=109376 RepID=A0A0D3BFG8_BRAOL
MGWAVCGRSHGSRVYNSSPNSTINPGIATASPSIFGRRKPSMISLSEIPLSSSPNPAILVVIPSRY